MGRDFYLNGTQLEVKTSTPSNVAFKVAGSQDSKNKHINADIEAKYSNKAHGIVFTQGWTTSNVLKTQVEAENHLTKGLKFDLSTSLLPDSGKKSALLTTTYKQPGLHTRAFLDLFKVGILNNARKRPSRLIDANGLPFRAPLSLLTLFSVVTVSSSVPRPRTT